MTEQDVSHPDDDRCEFCGDEATSEFHGRQLCDYCDEVLAELIVEIFAHRPEITECEVAELLDEVDELTWPEDVELAIERLPCTTDSEASG